MRIQLDRASAAHPHTGKPRRETSSGNHVGKPRRETSSGNRAGKPGASPDRETRHVHTPGGRPPRARPEAEKLGVSTRQENRAGKPTAARARARSEAGNRVRPETAGPGVPRDRKTASPPIGKPRRETAPGDQPPCVPVWRPEAGCIQRQGNRAPSAWKYDRTTRPHRRPQSKERPTPHDHDLETGWIAPLNSKAQSQSSQWGPNQIQL